MDTSIRSSTAFPQNDIEYAKSIARKMFELYDRDQSKVIENYEVGSMMQDTYRNLNKTYSPSKFEVDGYAKIMDKNGDGKVTLSDLEAICIKYLCGENTSPYRIYEETAKRSAAGSYLPDTTYPQSPGKFAEDQYTYSSEPFRNGGIRTTDINGSYGRGETVKRSAGVSSDESLNVNAIYIQKGKLDQIRRVFDMFDEDKNGEIDERELKNLMEETYRILGVNRQITNEDVQNYFALIDSNRDGRISLSRI